MSPRLLCLVRYIVVVLAAWTPIIGCADKSEPTTRPASLRERTRDAFADDMPTVSGAEGEKFDEKGFKRDWDRFWNP